MGHEAKYKIQNFKTLKGNIGENSNELEFNNDILDTTPKAQNMKEKESMS